jgi:acyl-CoA ligase (AMP-forming) (exosortase A-associated)
MAPARVPALLHELVLTSADRSPDATACTASNEPVGYGAFAQNIDAYASGLTEAGLRRFDRVAVYLPKLLPTVTALFGTSRAGGIVVPVNPLLKAPQVHHILRDCGARILISSASRLQSLQPHLADLPNLSRIVLIDDYPAADARVMNWADLCNAGVSDRPRVLQNDVAAILYTSGSTGRPKGVVLSHQNLVVGALSVASYLGNCASDRILSVLPLSFDAGFSQLSTGFLVGARVVLLDYLLAKDVVRVCEREQITGITGVPPLWVQLAALDWPAAATESLRYFANTGGKMPRETLARLRGHFPKAAPYLMYGLTEAFRSTYLPPAEVDARPDSIGKAIPNAEILVLRPDGSEAAPGEPGELVHRGPLVAQGYWNDPERTAERFRPLTLGPAECPRTEYAVWSGDTVVRDEEGFLYFVGRKDDMIKTSGYRVSPTEVEEAAYASGKVREAAAIGAEHPALGQGIVLLAVAAEGADPPEAELVASLRASLPAFMVPHRILWFDELPKNPNGKIDRSRLRDEYAHTFEEAAT